MAAKTISLDNIEQQQKNIKRKIRRCKESGDIKRLLGIRDQLERIRKNIGEIKDYRLSSPVFRRSYEYESFMESLLTGRGLRHQVIKWDGT